eukprot:scaffold179313_cov33-Tisochrysis_lutea.AAC.3
MAFSICSPASPASSRAVGVVTLSGGVRNSRSAGEVSPPPLRSVAASGACNGPEEGSGAVSADCSCSASPSAPGVQDVVTSSMAAAVRAATAAEEAGDDASWASHAAAATAVACVAAFASAIAELAPDAPTAARAPLGRCP